MKSSAAGRVNLLDIFNVAHQIFKTRKFKEGPLCPHDGRSWSQKNASVFFLKLSITLPVIIGGSFHRNLYLIEKCKDMYFFMYFYF